ncbi:MAG: BACON domain-containing protein [Bacteroidales bacterium]|nr:BACON domain-containing protein [Bacteroidales bacterium]
MKNVKFYVLAALALAIASCKPVEVEDSLQVSTATISVGAYAEPQTISFTTNTSWKMTSEVDWVTVSPDSGEAGNSTVTVRVADNGTFQERSGKIILTAGNKTTTWTVKQGFVNVFEATAEMNISSEAQTLSILINTNSAFTAESDAEWLTVVATKAAPSEKTVTVNAAANATIEPRTAHLTVTSDNGASTYAITQAPSDNAMVLEEVRYLGHSIAPYDHEEYVPTSFEEYALVFSTSKGKVVLAVNVEEKGVLTGEYDVDAAADHSANTFSLNNSGEDDYYTAICEGEVEIPVADGLITIEEAEGVLTVSAALMDEHENVRTYTFSGEMPEVIVDNYRAEIAVNFDGDYWTHFANGAQQYSITLYPSAPLAEGAYDIYSMSFKIFGDKSCTNAKLPLGSFTFVEGPETVEHYSRNGKNLYPYNSFTGNSIYMNYRGDYEMDYGDILGGTLSIAEGSEPDRYDITVDFNVKGYWYNEDWDIEYGDEQAYKYEYKDVKIVISDNHTGAVEDGDDVFVAPTVSANYLGYAAENYYAEGGTAFILYWSGISNEYMVYLPLHTASEWVFEKNYANRFCSTPVPDGVYAMAEKPVDAEGKPVDCFAFIDSKGYRSVTNNYTGTITYIKEGTVTISGNGTQIEMDLTTVKADGSEGYHFTGSFATTVNYLQSASATWQNRMKWTY